MPTVLEVLLGHIRKEEDKKGSYSEQVYIDGAENKFDAFG